MQFTDHLGNTISLRQTPQRIVSLVPSQSELLWDLGLQSRLAGITKFCIHPAAMHRQVVRVGGTKTLHIDKIRALEPDLIIGNKEENERSQIELLQQNFNVWMSDIHTVEDALRTISDIGVLTGTSENATAIAENIRASFAGLPHLDKTVLYLIWKPYMAAGRKTFIGDMLSQLGLQNAISDVDSRYPALTPDAIRALNPQLVFLSSEPFPFAENHLEELQLLLPGSQIVLVDGELFSWYGSRLQKSAAYFHSLLSRLS